MTKVKKIFKKYKKAFKKKELKSFSLVEILLVIGLFSLVAGSSSVIVIDSIRSGEHLRKKYEANIEVQKELNALLINKNTKWLDIINNTENGAKHLEYSSDSFSIADGEVTENEITTGFVINNVYRDGSGDIVQTGGALDPDSREVVFSANWQDSLGIARSLSSVIYITNWNIPTWKETTQTDFQDGTTNGTIVTDNGDGSVELDLSGTINADWCLPQITLTEYDLPGNGVAKTISAIPGNAFMGTGDNASGLSFINALITDTDPPVVTVPGTFDGAKTNAVFGETDYAYLGTDTNSEEIIILDLTSTPYTQVGYVDGPGSNNADSIFVEGNTGYFIQGDQLHLFDLTSKSGSRPILGSYTLLNTGVKIFVQGNYAYVIIAGGGVDMQIVDISDPSNMSTVGTANIPSSVNVSDIWVTSDSTRAFIGTDTSSSASEIYMFDISTKTGTMPLLTEIETNGMSVKDLVTVEDKTRLIATGTGGEEYQVFDTTDELNPAYCGGLNIDSGINGVAAVGFTDTFNTYAYVVTNDATAELKVIRGGAIGGGGGNGQGSQYLDSGDYTSSVFDTGVATTQYYSLSWDETLKTNTDIQVQIRTGDTSDLSGETWMGPDGTSNSYFTESSGEYLPSTAQSKRYIQYKVNFTSDRVNTGVFEEIRISYQ